MTTLREAAQMALEALEFEADGWEYPPAKTSDAIAALRAALAEPVQKPTFPEWQRGCQACGAHGNATGYVCPRYDCPTKVTCGGAV